MEWILIQNLDFLCIGFCKGLSLSSTLSSWTGKQIIWSITQHNSDQFEDDAGLVECCQLQQFWPLLAFERQAKAAVSEWAWPALPCFAINYKTVSCCQTDTQAQIHSNSIHRTFDKSSNIQGQLHSQSFCSHPSGIFFGWSQIYKISKLDTGPSFPNHVHFKMIIWATHMHMKNIDSNLHYVCVFSLHVIYRSYDFLCLSLFV